MPSLPTWRAAAACLVIAAVPCVNSIAYGAPPASTAAPAAIGFPNGVAVVALDDAADEAWSLAARVYADPLLRPSQLDDATARVLAGEPVAGAAGARLRELAKARQALKASDPMIGRMAGSIGADLGGANVLLVSKTAGGPHARLFITSARSFFSPELWQQKNAEGAPSWEAATAWLHCHALASRPIAQPEPPKSKSIFKSVWFWGVLGAAATIGIVAATIGSSDDSSDSIHVKGRVGP